MYSARPLGQLLVTSGLLSQQALDEVLAMQKTDPRRFGELLADRGLMRPHQLAQFLSHQLACPWVSLQRVEVSREAVNVLPREIALKHYMVPVHLRTSRGSTALYVAMDDPTDEVALAEASSAATMPVKPMVALASEVRELLARLYGGDSRESSARPASLAALGESDSPASPFPPQVKPRSLPVPPPRISVKAAAIAPLAESTPPPSTEDASMLEDDDVIPDSKPSLDDAAVPAPAPARPPPRVYAKGELIDGRYELLRDVGGRVAGSRWEALHARTARRCILKVGVRTDESGDSDADAVRREHLALRRIQHPGAIDLRDAGATESGDPYIVVELLEGRTLEGLVAARGALQPTEACALIRQVGEVLATAHPSGVLHHEVRPENVLVMRDPRGVERVKLMHWESATTVDGDPEAAVDLAGLGACAFLALVGRARHDGEDVAQLTLPPPLKAVIAHAIGGANARRFASVREFIDALEAAAPRRRDSLALLRAAPEKRGSSVEPPAPSEALPAVPTPTPASVGEQRRFPRAPYRTPVRIDVAGVGAVDGRTEDISEGGLFVVTRLKIADAARVSVRFALPIDGKVVSENGIVRWSRQGSDARAIGIELASPAAETVRQIARYVSLMSAGDAAEAKR